MPTDMITIFLILILVYFYALYFTGRKYLETYQDAAFTANGDPIKRFHGDGSPETNLNKTVYPPENPT